MSPRKRLVNGPKSGASRKSIKNEIRPEDIQDVDDELADDLNPEEDENAELTGDFDPNLPVPSLETSSSVDVDVSGLPSHLDPLKRYIQEISRYALLTPDEEFALAVRLKGQGDLEAARRLVNANLRLVV